MNFLQMLNVTIIINCYWLWFICRQLSWRWSSLLLFCRVGWSLRTFSTQSRF